MRNLRKKVSIRVEDVAEALGITASTVWNWEQGRTIPRLRIDQIAKLLRLYNCTFEELEQAVEETSKVK
jgi:transcriptional regulator with XRE-family HTH domain